MDQLFKKRNQELKEFSSWLKRHKPKPKKEIPDNIFKQCDACHESIPYFSFVENNYVCPKCGHHMKISARQRIRNLIIQYSILFLRRVFDIMKKQQDCENKLFVYKYHVFSLQ